MTKDDCPLCGYHMDKHTVMVEKVKVNGRKGVRPIGWKCPDSPKRKI